MSELFADKALLHAGLYIVAAFAGQLFYAVKQWADGEVDCVWHQFSTNPRRTVGAVIGNMTGMVTIVAALDLSAMPMSAVVIMAFLQGISADSVLNKSKRIVWSDAERVAAGAKP